MINNAEFSQENKLQPQVGISACLRGEYVRYDGGAKFQPLIEEHLAPLLQLIPFCPEVAAGLGTPRPPVRLIQTSGGVIAQGVENEHLDVTVALSQSCKNYVQKQAINLTAYIVKARSPSCGSNSTPLYDVDKTVQGKTDGLLCVKGK